MYSVFVKILLTEQGKKIVHEHQGDKDAQNNLRKKTSNALKYTRDLLNSSNILTYIISTRVVCGSWCDNKESFIINRQDQIQLYKNLVNISDHLYGVKKPTMLDNDVDPI